MFDIEESMDISEKSVNGGGGGVEVQNGNGSIYQMSRSAYNDIMNYNKKRQAAVKQPAPEIKYIVPEVKYVAPTYNVGDYLYKQALMDYSEQAYNNKLKNILYEQEKSDLLYQLKKLKETSDVKGTLEELLKDEETAKKLLAALGEIKNESKSERKKPVKKAAKKKSKSGTKKKATKKR